GPVRVQQSHHRPDPIHGPGDGRDPKRGNPDTDRPALVPTRIPPDRGGPTAGPVGRGERGWLLDIEKSPPSSGTTTKEQPDVQKNPSRQGRFAGGLCRLEGRARRSAQI